MKDLLEMNGRDWNKDLLTLMFSEEDQKSIEMIRPGGECIKDGFNWDYSRSGHYSVKSGYWVLTQVLFKKNSLEVTQPSLDLLYQRIWQLDAPPKVQHFIWKCLSNRLSMAENLFNRHLTREGMCLRCPSQRESGNHLLFRCSFARLVWAISPIPAPSGGDWSESIYANLWSLLNFHQHYPQQRKDTKLIPWILWRLWKNRNALIFKGHELDALSVIRLVEEDANEWDRRKEGESRVQRVAVQRPPVKWKPPPQDWVKCNTDGAWPKAADRCGIGWVLRNSTGNVLWLGARALPRTQSVLEVEAEAMRWAVVNLSRFHYQKFIFESDSQELISLIGGEETRPKIEPILQDLKQLLLYLKEVKFVCTRRGGNEVADRIAKESLSFLNYDPKLYSIVPNWLRSHVETDKCM